MTLCIWLVVFPQHYTPDKSYLLTEANRLFKLCVKVSFSQVFNNQRGLVKGMVVNLLSLAKG